MPDPDNLKALLDKLSPEVYEALKLAVELGKWQNGVRLTREQRETCLQAVIYYDGRHKPQQERVGYIQPVEHEHCGSDGDQQHDHSGNRWSDEQVLVFREMLQTNPVRH